MRRLIASRKLQRKCFRCNCNFKKGDVYYKYREVFEEDGTVYGSGYLECARCKYVWAEHRERFAEFIKVCTHPDQFIEEIWTYMTGEAVKEPSHCECRLCNQAV